MGSLEHHSSHRGAICAQLTDGLCFILFLSGTASCCGGRFVGWVVLGEHQPWPGCIGAALVCSALVWGRGAVGKGFLLISNQVELLGSEECCRTARAGSRAECNACCGMKAKLWGDTWAVLDAAWLWDWGSPHLYGALWFLAESATCSLVFCASHRGD